MGSIDEIDLDCEALFIIYLEATCEGWEVYYTLLIGKLFICVVSESLMLNGNKVSLPRGEVTPFGLLIQPSMYGFIIQVSDRIRNPGRLLHPLRIILLTLLLLHFMDHLTTSAIVKLQLVFLRRVLIGWISKIAPSTWILFHNQLLLLVLTLLCKGYHLEVILKVLLRLVLVHDLKLDGARVDSGWPG